MKIHLSASCATNNSMPDLIRNPDEEGKSLLLSLLPKGETGYRLSPVWIQNAIFGVIPHATCEWHHEGRKYLFSKESKINAYQSRLMSKEFSISTRDTL
jgi:hypothetical protein